MSMGQSSSQEELAAVFWSLTIIMQPSKMVSIVCGTVVLDALFHSEAFFHHWNALILLHIFPINTKKAVANRLYKTD